MALERSTRARFVVSLDFELYWGVLDGMALDRYAANLDGVRDAVPALLELFEARAIAATWATVGMLLADDFDEAIASAPGFRLVPRPGHVCPYRYARVESVMPRRASLPHRQRHFAPDLAARIVATPRQELACHGYAHVGYLDARPDPAALRADLEAMRAIAERKLGVTPTSLVFPRNQCDDDAIDAAVDAGFRVQRGTSGKSYEAPVGKDEDHLARRLLRAVDSIAPIASPALEVTRRGRSIDVPGSRFFRPLRSFVDPIAELELRRIDSELRAAARAGALYHLWFHPHNFGRDTRANLRRLERVLDVVGELRESGAIESVTMRDAAKGVA